MTGFTTAGARGGLFNQIGGTAGGSPSSSGGGSASIIDWANVTNKPDPVITLTGSVSGSATMTDLQDMVLNTESEVYTVIALDSWTPVETGINITTLLDGLGDTLEAAGGITPDFTTIVIRSENWTDPINLGSRIQIKNPLNGVKIIILSPLNITEGGSIRLRGSEDEFYYGYDGVTIGADSIPRPRAVSGVDGSGNMTLAMEYLDGNVLSTPRSDGFTVNDIIVIRGCLDPLTGSSLQKMFAKVASIDTLTNTLVLDRPPQLWEDSGDIARINSLTNLTVVTGDPMVFYPDYYQPDGVTPLTNPYSADAAIQTRLQIVTASEMAAIPAEGDQYYTVENASVFSKGDMVLVMDDQSEDDFVEPDVGFKYPMNRTTASVVDVDLINNRVYLDRVVKDVFDAAFFPRIIKVKPMNGMDLVIQKASYGAEQLIEFRNFYLTQLDFCVNSSVCVKEVIGYDLRRAAAIRLSSSMHCRVYDSKILGATDQSTGGIGYGVMLYYGSNNTVENCYISGCRHAILAQHSSLGRIHNNYLVDDYISAIDIHGTRSNGWIITNNQVEAILRNENGPADNRSGIKIGNQSHPLPDAFTLIANNQVNGYWDTDNDGAGIDIVPPAQDILITGNMVKDCYAGIYLGSNSSTRVLFDTSVKNLVITNNYVQGAMKPIDITGVTLVANLSTARDVIVKGNSFIECDGPGLIDLVDYVYCADNTHRSAANAITTNYVNVTNSTTQITPDIDSVMSLDGVVRLDTDGSNIDAYLPMTITSDSSEPLTVTSTGLISRAAFYDSTTVVAPLIGSSGDDFSIRTNDTNRVTVKSDGSVVTGSAQTNNPSALTAGSATGGFALTDGGQFKVGVDSAYAGRFNRHTTYGELVGFYVDGVEAGTIKAVSDGTVDLEITGHITTGDTVDGRFIATDGAKLDGIEALATADQTDAEIRTAVEAATDSNVFTDADHTKLNGVEALATADQTDAEIRTAVEAATDSNVFTDADHTKLDGVEALATADQTAGEIEAIVSHDNLLGVVANEHIDWTVDQGATDIHLGNLPATALTTVQTAITELAMLALTTEAGDVVVRTDLPATYMHNGGVAGTIADFTLLEASLGGGGGAVTSVNALTGAVVLTHDGFADFVANEHIDWTVDQGGTDIHSGNLPAGALTTVQTAISEAAMLALTTDVGDVVVRTELPATYMHNGGVAGTMADFTLLEAAAGGGGGAVTSVNALTGAVVLTHDGFADFVANEHIDWTTDQGATNVHASNYTDTTYTSSDFTFDGLSNVTITTIAAGEIPKWSGTAWINNTLAEAGISAVGHTHVAADVTDFDTEVANNTAVAANTAKVSNVTQTTVTGNAGSATTLSVGADRTKLDGIEALADVTDVTNVTAAGALMDSEVSANLKTLVLPATTTISAYGASLVDDATAADARTTLGLGTAATTASTAYATSAQGTTADAALPKTGGAMTGAITTTSTFDGRDVATDGTKLDGIEALATADQTAAEIRAAVEAAIDSNVFTDADHTKLNAAAAFTTTTVTGTTPSLDLAVASYFSGGTFNANTTISFANVPAGSSRWTYSAPIGATGGFDLTNAAYDGISWSTSSEESSPYGIFFKDDGLKMYLIGSGGDDVNEYTMSTAWDLSTLAYVQRFSITGEDLNSYGIFISPAGTEMYITGNDGDDINQYTLSTAWDVSSATFTRLFSVATQETSPQGVWFKTDGLEMYVAGDSSDNVNQYTLTTAWDISTATITNVLSVSAQDIQPNCCTFNGTGTVMMVAGSSSDSIYQYDLGTAWDLSTATFTRFFFSGYEDERPECVVFNTLGDKMYVLGNFSDAIYQYSTPTFATMTLPAAVSNTPVVNYAAGDRVTFEFVTLDGGTTVDVIAANVV